MSFFRGGPSGRTPSHGCAIARVIVPRTVDLGDLAVRRALPSAQSRMVGPFIFFDHFGPAEFQSGQGLDVRPHPHIGLATVTYLFDGEIMHRDSLGVVAPIRPGEINWMTAGRGIVHSERTASNGAPAATCCMACGCGSPCRLPRRNGPLLPITASTIFRWCGSGQVSARDDRHASMGSVHRSQPPRRRCLPTRRLIPARSFRSMPATRNAPSTSCPAKSTSWAIASEPTRSWCCAPAIQSP